MFHSDEIALLLPYFFLFAGGLVAGFLNTLSGGGSAITLPLLILTGLGGVEANATNRVSVFLQSLTGASYMRKMGRLNHKNLRIMIPVTLFGAASGAMMATIISNELFEPLVFSVMVAFSVYLLFQERILKRKKSSGSEIKGFSFASYLGLYAAGFYGGFLQAGVGLVLLFVLMHFFRYDIVAANAIKLVVVVLFTFVSLAIFIAEGLVRWIPGLVLSAGSVIGAYIGVRYAIHADQRKVRIVLFLLVMTSTIIYLLKQYFAR